MQYTDYNDYERRIKLIREVAGFHPELMGALPDGDRGLLETYFLDCGRAPDLAEYRRRLIKRHPNIERQANRAYERFLVEAGMPEMLAG
jgi:hypothetical protein